MFVRKTLAYNVDEIDGRAATATLTNKEASNIRVKLSRSQSGCQGIVNKLALNLVFRPDSISSVFFLY